MQKHDAVLVLDGIEMQVGAPVQFRRQRGKLEIVRCEQREASVGQCQLARDRPRQRQAIEGGRAAADFIDQSLVLIDEIGRGTSTFDGLSLAWAIARQLALTNRCLALFATHYFELTALPSELDGCANLHFDAVEHKNGIVFLHAVEDGPANQSYGLQVAKLAGVPAEALRQARTFLARLDQFSVRRDIQ